MCTRILLLSLATLLTVMAPIFGHSQEASPAGRRIVVWIAVTDSWVFTEAHNKAMQRDALRLNPGAVIVPIKLNAMTRLNRAESIRRALVNKARRIQLQPGDVVTHIVMSGHAGTYDDGTRTGFRHMGDFDENGPDDKLRELLEPIRNFTSPDVIVVQNGCSTLCGNEPEVRSRALLEYLNAPNGQIFGSTTAETAPVIFPKLAIPFTLAVAAALHMKPEFRDVSTFVSAMTGLIAGAPTISRFVGSNLGVFNFGKILRFKNGKVEESAVVLKKDNIDAIYRRESCIRALKSSSGIYSAEELGGIVTK